MNKDWTSIWIRLSDILFVFKLFFFSFTGIIKCVTLTTAYINSMWWPPNRTVGGMLHQMIFLVLSALSVFNYVMGTIIGPGFLPLGWEPKVSPYQQEYKIIRFSYSILDSLADFWVYGELDFSKRHERIWISFFRFNINQIGFWNKVA